MNVDNLKNYAVYILIGIIVQFICEALKSKFLVEFLGENLITILIALLAINATTSSIVMTNITEFAEQFKVDFDSTLQELKLSLKEQIYFVSIAIIILILRGSKLVLSLYEQSENVLQIGLIAVFVASLRNLYDTADSIFVISNWKNKQNN